MTNKRRIGDRRQANVILLCEDKQHHVFMRRFLKEMGWKKQPRINPAPSGRGSGEHFVRKQFVKELAEYRRHRNRVSSALVVMIDGDKRGLAKRRAELEAECRQENVPFVESTEQVLIVVPTWEIETWLAYLDGQDLDERASDYPRLSRQRKCSKRQVKALAHMCRNNELRNPAPPSLVSACKEYNKRMTS